MDVPFVSSGALSRTHYTLVKSIESSPSPEIADRYILKEVESIRFRLRHPTISLKETRECLIILLYCFMTIASPTLPSLDFALPQAVNLAEAGKKVHEKRIGYLFCTEIMSPQHELRLMLVNTLRKDLESPTTALVCLSLDNLIVSPSEDVIPAVQSRLQDLLSNQSPHVRRRALLACSALARYEPDLLRRITSKVLKRLRDPHPAVTGAALTVSVELVKVHEPSKKDVQKAVNDLLQRSWSNFREQSIRCVLLRVLSALRGVGLLESNLGLVLEIIRSTSETSDHPVMCAAFLLLSDANVQELLGAQPSQDLSPAANIRGLITSRSANDQYIFLSCLSCLNPEVWAGTNAEIPAVLDEWEVGRVMEFLDSSDTVIRRKTLGILNRIDGNIVQSYYAQSLRTLPDDLNLSGISEYTTRLLEVVEVETEGDGELYARQLGDLFAQMEARSPRYAQIVVETAVEMVLLHLRNAASSFQIGCATTLVTYLASPEIFFGQTMMVIVPALATEYSGKLSVPPPDVLRGLSSRLPLCSLAVQDACLLAMLRISAECEQVPSEIFVCVNDLSNRSGRHIRQRCEEFTSLAAQKDVLGQIIQSAQSSSLPDFLEALHGYKMMSFKSKPTADLVAEPSSPSSSRASLSASKLRYTAYEPPPPMARLRDRASSGGSSRSGSSKLSGTTTGVLEELSRTVTAGDLTLAAAARSLETSSHISETPPAETLTPHADLIAFNDSPFISDPAVGVPADFESIWNSLDESSGARGWCDVSLEDVVKRLESMEDTMTVISVEELPFVGYLKVLINGEDATRGLGVLRLRASEEGSCLWRMRCGDAQLRIRVKRLLLGVE
ncbi:armadillo-type protein [Mycena maculata]|uniref:Armadillo-type protein n=1 Tax=Mycena maculata TaxID=230809 RepID=A0AAD7J2S5_9AGAR|nr:armadillo-type protein [Mycena maculata]